jgi:hypothetical protein
MWLRKDGVRNWCSILVRNLKGRGSHKREEKDLRMSARFALVREGLLAVSYEHSNETSTYAKFS